MIKINGKLLDFEIFPNGETRVNGDQLTSLIFSFNKVTFKYENDSDLLKLMFVKRYIDDFNKMAALQILYMPYSRMDRKEGNSVFTLKYTADFINSLNFTSVEIIEPHSDVTLALINKSYATYPSINLLDSVIKEVDFNKEVDYLFFPDAGAQKRYSKVTGFKQLVGNKVRNFATGRIESLEVAGSLDSEEFKVIIVDDLSSYGGTFMLSAKSLKPLGASEIYLLVGHCEHSIYKGEIPDSDLINKVFTTDSILNKSEHEKIHVYEIGGN